MRLVVNAMLDLPDCVFKPNQKSLLIDLAGKSVHRGCCVGAVLDEEPGQIHMTPFGRPIQRSRPVLVPGCRIGAVLDEEPGHIHMTQ